MKLKLFAIFGIFVFFSFAFVSANGCCYYESSGICSQNVEKAVCDNARGVWTFGSSCNRAECKLGCCILGTMFRFITDRTCQIESLARGFTKSWQESSSLDSCYALVSQKEMGACIYNSDSCNYVKKDRCMSKNFHVDKLCSDSSLNTRCKKTSKTRCFEDGVYHLDSCGNQDELVQICNYEKGFICRQKSSNEAFCKNLNCDTIEKKNGESWCVGLNGKKYSNLDVRRIGIGQTNLYPELFVTNVGSEFFKQSCIDGEVVTEPCAPYRSEVCVSDGVQARCIANLGADCYSANLDEPLLSTKNSDVGKYVNGVWTNQPYYSYVDYDSCDPEWCYVWRALDCVKSDEGGGQTLCGQERWNRGVYPQFSNERGDGEFASATLADLSLNRCVPKIPIGHDISIKGFGDDVGGYCSMADFSANTWLDHDMGSRRWFIKSSDTHNTFVSKSEGRYGNAGLISLNPIHWRFYDEGELTWNLNVPENKNPLYLDSSNSCWIDWSCGSSFLIRRSLVQFRSAISKGKLVDPILIKLLNKRASIGFGDCAGSLNFIGEKGSISNYPFSNSARGQRDDLLLFSFSFTTRSFRPPSSGDCDQCGKMDLPCSEYRCNALGRNCEYKEPRGIDSGVCISSNDFRPPVISHSQNPSEEIPPFSPVVITLTTDEDSYCKFDFGSVDGTIEGLRYETSGEFARKHTFVLNVPGRARYDDDFPELPLLTRDGNYTLFVRCEDGAGNYNVNPYLVPLNVMDTPDGLPANILEFYPLTNSFVKYNTTEKEIRFKLNEPAECRWDFEDKEYKQMGEMISLDFNGEENSSFLNSNQFFCRGLSNEDLFQGYFCSKTLTNVTLEIGRSTKYFIRCKDQPWLEENNPNPAYYSRNVNQRSFEYVLRPSLALEIFDHYPFSGVFVVGGSVGNITYTLTTKGGAERGKASCEWRIKTGEIRTSWQSFDKTNSSNHEMVLTSLQTADYSIESRCEDIAGNRANLTTQLNIVMDTNPPEINRLYNDRGNLKISLNEKANCKFVTKTGCHTVFANGTLMFGSADRTEFTTNLVKATPYFIRCEDDFGNSRCFRDIIFY